MVRLQPAVIEERAIFRTLNREGGRGQRLHGTAFNPPGLD
jgi:hypothetical protein